MESVLVAERVVNVASVPHRSPFRYPGGKTWLVPDVRRWLASLPQKPAELCEPFCGGAIVGLSALFEGLTESLTLVELDDDVSAVWTMILSDDAQDLVQRIESFEISPESVRAVLSSTPTDLLDRAFVTILRNRVQRGGILAPGASLMKYGENGRGLASRWYALTLKKRINAIWLNRHRIRFIHGDGVSFIRDHASRNDAAFFIDPPYTVAGRRLYAHSEVDHFELVRVLSSIKGDFLATYDDAKQILSLAQLFELDTHTVAMKNTHHRIMRELLIGRDLSWARTSS